MTHDELKSGISERANLTIEQAGNAMKAHYELIEEGLIKDHEVRLLGIGTLKLKYRAARMGRNPRTKEEIPIAEAIGLGVTISKPLKTNLNTPGVIDFESFKK